MPLRGSLYGLFVVALVFGGVECLRPMLYPEQRITREVVRTVEEQTAEREASSTLASEARQPVDIDEPAATVAAPIETDRAELDQLRAQNEWLARELQALKVSVALERIEGPGGTVGEWMRFIPPESLPSSAALELMAEYLEPYPVTLAVHEGAWLFERMARDDWLDFADTIDEAIVGYLAPDRIAREVTAEQLAKLREEWAEEALFPP